MTESPTGRTFSEIVQRRAGREPAFVNALLEEAVQAMLAGEVGTARGLVRDVIKGTIGYAELSRRTGTPEKSLVRMFGATGNPTLANVSSVLLHLQQHGRVRLRVTAEPVPRQRSARKQAATTPRVA